MRPTFDMARLAHRSVLIWQEVPLRPTFDMARLAHRAVLIWQGLLGVLLSHPVARTSHGSLMLDLYVMILTCLQVKRLVTLIHLLFC